MFGVDSAKSVDNEIHTAIRVLRDIKVQLEPGSPSYSTKLSLSLHLAFQLGTYTFWVCVLVVAPFCVCGGANGCTCNALGIDDQDLVK